VSMQSILVVGNPVMSSAETTVVIKEYGSTEEAEQEIQESVLDEPERLGGCCYTFKEGTPYRGINLITHGEGFVLKEHCPGEAFGPWESHGGRCPCGAEPERYSPFTSPRFVTLRHVVSGAIRSPGEGEG
jgi:hypothetical protein